MSEKDDLIERFWILPFRHDFDNENKVAVLLDWMPEDRMLAMVEHLENMRNK
jgi:hypothetical protein